MTNTQPQPLPIGTPFDGSTITEVVQYDPDDTEQPYLYQLADGTHVWIDQDGDEGAVTCGRCEKILKRCEAGMDLEYLYVCNDCEEKHGRKTTTAAD